MDKEGICSLEWILYIDYKAILKNGGHYQKTSSSTSGEILSKLNLVSNDWVINMFPSLLSRTIISVMLDSYYNNARLIFHHSPSSLAV